MPDDELFAAAKAGKLQDDAALRQQIRRMLRDAKAVGGADNFVGQWLGLRALGETIKPDGKKYPEFTPELAAAMRREPVELFAHLVRENRPLLELLDADYTFADEAARQALRPRRRQGSGVPEGRA